MSPHREDVGQTAGVSRLGYRAVLTGAGVDPVIELVFPYDATHAHTGQCLREWVKGLDDRRWDAANKVWLLLDPASLPKGVLKEAGFSVVGEDGQPIKRGDVIVPRRVRPKLDEADLAIPEWFGLELYDYQHTGAIMVAAGRSALCDVPGLGKTRQGLAAAAALGARRTLILCPPVVVTHWEREVTQSGLGVERAALAATAPAGGSEKEEPAALPNLAPPEPTGVAGSTSILSDAIVPNVSTFRSGRKAPALPDAGVVVVPDTLVAARPSLASQLVAWCPDVMIYDEAHRAKTWDSRRSRVARRLAAVSTHVICASGTPLFANPTELAPLLAMTGHLDEVFGGKAEFCERYAKQNKYKAWKPRRDRLPELRRKLDASVWVQRNKDQVATDLPAKSRRADWVDVDTSDYNAAYQEVVAQVDQWLDSYAGRPDDEAIEEWCGGQLGLISVLRRAAGLAKVEYATEMVAEWVAANTEIDSNGRAVCTRPLVVWTHHRVVTEAMAASVPLAVGGAGVIAGGTSHNERARLVDDFQAGLIPVLVCSIAAAGVGITLTRASDMVFVETDWTPALITQAEDRCHRIGQENHVTATTLIAPGTLDEHIQSVLRKKAITLDAVMTGGDHAVAVSPREGKTDAASVLSTIVKDCLARRQHGEKAA
jgi:hypothetical protein